MRKSRAKPQIPTTRRCVECGNEFTTYHGLQAKASLCSKECKKIRKNRQWRQATALRTGAIVSHDLVVQNLLKLLKYTNKGDFTCQRRS